MSSTRETLHADNYSVVWVSYVNDGLFDIFVTDKITEATHHIAEYDGYKYQIRNKASFNNVYIPVVRENAEFVKKLRSFIDKHKPERNDFSAIRKRSASKFAIWRRKNFGWISRGWKNLTK